VDLKDIKAIIDLMKKNAISEFEMEKQDFKIKLKRGISPSPASLEESAAPSYIAPHPIGTSQNVVVSLPASSESGDVEIKSPMIGTFYRAPSPESGNYVEIGTEVNADTVVCIIEAMKVMNEIKAEAKGIITQPLVENAKPVEFGQPLFKLRPL
jgi:acetyl-CoA carboxylase biotin carboxyl carrier protein